LLPQYATPATVFTPPGTPGRPERVVLEVGCGHGAAALGYAAAYPSHHVVATDVHPPGIARMLAAGVAEGIGVDRLSARLGDAVELLEQLPEGVLDVVHVFFPDPWPKARHARRRLLSGPTLGLLASRLTPGGEVLLATDQPEYAAWVAEQVAEAVGSGWVLEPAQRPRWRPVAGYEAKGVAAGRPPIERRLTVERDDVVPASIA